MKLSNLMIANPFGLAAAKHKQAIDEDILQQIRTVQLQLRGLEQQFSNQSKASVADHDSSFLLTEFKELGEARRHETARVHTEFNLYLTVTTIVVTAVVFLAQRVTDIRALLFLALPTIPFLSVLSLGLARRIVKYESAKRQYIHAQRMIRRYFVTKDAEIAPYVVLSYAVTPDSPPESSGELLDMPISRRLLVAVHVWPGLLLGFTVSLSLWLMLPALPLAFIVASGLIVTLVCTVILSTISLWMLKHL